MDKLITIFFLKLKKQTTLKGLWIPCFIFFLFPVTSFSQTFGGADCGDAAVICHPSQVIRDTVPFPVYKGTNEIISYQSCINKNETVPYWYKFTAATSGSFEMKITPKDGSFYNDWDFALFDVTDGCASLTEKGRPKVIACNNSAECNQPTGISSIEALTWTPDCDVVNPWSNTVNLIAGRTYAIFLDAFEWPGATFSIEFNMNNLPDAVQFTDVQADFTSDDNQICTGETINFTNTSIYPQGSSFLWTFGDGTTATTLDASHTFNTAGTYDVILEVYNESCGDADTVKQIEVVPAVIPSFTATNLCYQDTVTFTSTSQGNPSIWTWDFGADANPGTASTEGTHDIYYSSTGIKSVSLFLDNGVCTADTIIDIEIHALPIVTSSALPNPSCNGEQVDLSAAGAANYNWHIEGSSTLIGSATPLAVFPTDTTTYLVIGTDTNGCIDSATVQVNVHDLPTATVTASKDSVCSTDGITLYVQFDAPFIPAASNAYSFDGGNTFQTEDTFNIAQVLADTTINVVVEDINGCRSEVIPYSIKVIAPLVPSFSFNDTCQGKEITFTNTSSPNATSWVWNFGLDAIPQTENGEGPYYVTYSSSGTKTVTLTIDNAVCDERSVSHNVEIFPLPAVETTALPDTLCFGQFSELVVQNAFTYEWYETGTTTVISTNDTISVNPAVTTSYAAIGTDLNGCQNADTVEVVVNPLPTATVLGSKTQVCRFEDITLTADFNAPFIPAATNAYSFDGGNTFQDANTFYIPSVAADSTVNVVVEDVNGCRSNIIPYAIDVIPELIPDFTFNNACQEVAITFTDASTGDPASWSWDFGADASPAAETTQGPHTVTYSAAGTKTVTLTIDNALCDVKSISHNVEIFPLPAVAVTASPDTLCFGQFSELVVQNASTYEWYETGTTTVISTNDTISANPAVTTSYAAIGTDLNGCQNADTVEVVVNPLPTGIVLGSKTQVCRFEDITLTADFDAPFIPAATNAYSFDGGNTFQDANTFYIPSVAADSTVNVVVEDVNGCRSNIIPYAIDVIPELIPDFTFNNACQEVAITFTDASTGDPASWSWDFGADASPAAETTQGPHTVTYSASGTKTVTLTIDNALCDVKSISHIVEIFPLPAVAVTASPDTLCFGQFSELVVQNASTYEWYETGTTTVISSNDTISVNPAVTTSYAAIGTDLNGCQNADTVEVVVNPLPTATVSASKTQVCRFEDITLTADFDAPFIPAATNAYSFDGGNTFQDANTFYIPSVAADSTVNVVVEDVNGCRSNVIPYAIDVIPELIPDFTFNNACQEVAITFTDASTGDPASWSWDFGADASPAAETTQGPHTVTYSAAGTKTVTLTIDNALCDVKSISHNVEIFPLPAVAVTASPDTLCFGQSSELVVQNAATYEWYETGTTTVISTNDTISANPAVTTSYAAIGTDLNGCQNTDTLEVVVNPLPTATVFGSKTQVCRFEDITLTADFDAPFIPAATNAYSFDGGNTFQDANTFYIPSVAADSTVNVVVEDVNGCRSNVIPYAIDVIPELIPAFTFNNACQEVAITFTDASTGDPASWSWDFGADASPAAETTQGPHTVTYSASGTKTVTLTIDNALCDVKSISHIVEIFPLPVVSVTSSADTSCSGSQVSLTANGAVAYSWYETTDFSSSIGSINPIDVFPTTTTTYAVRGTDNNGCTNMDSILIEVNQLPTATATGNPLQVCIGEAVTVTAEFDNPFVPASSGAYSFDSGITFQDTNSFRVNTVYSDTTINVLVIDANSCFSNSISVNVSIIEPLVASFSFNNTCHGDTVTFTSTSTGNPTSFIWDFDSGASISSSNEAGPHTVLYDSPGDKIISLTIDNADCAAKTTVQTLTIYSLPNVSITTSSDTTCAGVEEILTGTGADTYIWYDVDINSEMSTGESITVASSDTKTYSVTGTDANTCKNSDTITIIVNPLPTVTLTTSPLTICEGEGVTVSATFDSGFTPAPSDAYSFDGGNTFGDSSWSFISPINSDTSINVVVRDEKGCASNSIQTNVSVAPPLLPSFTYSDGCFGDTIVFTNNSTGNPTGFTWDFGVDANPVSSVTEGPHEVRYASPGSKTISLTISREGCSEKSIVNSINIFGLPDVNAQISEPEICKGQDVTLSATGADAYSWIYSGTVTELSDSSTFTDIPAADSSYIVTGTDINGCRQSDTVSVIVNPIPASTEVDPDTICQGGSSLVQAIFEPDFTPALTGAYSFDNGITFQDTNGYLVDPVMTDTIVNVVIKDINGCLSTTQQAPILIKTFTADITELSPVTCHGGSDGEAVIQNISEGKTPYEFSIDGTAFQVSNTFTGLSAGDYIITLRDSEACSYNFPVTITEPDSLIISISSKTDILCAGANTGEIRVNSQGGISSYEYSINGGPYQSENTFSDLPAGNYILTVRDSQGCMASVSAVVNEPSPLLIAITDSKNIACHGGFDGLIRVNASGGTANYSFSLDDVNYVPIDSFVNLTARSYTVYIRDFNGCKANQSLTLTEPSEITATPVIEQVPQCKTPLGIVSITNTTGGVPSYSFNVDGGAFSPDTIFDDLLSGIHIFTIRDQNGCNKEYEVNLEGDDNSPSGEAVSSPVSCTGSSDGSVSLINISGGTAPYQYSLNDTLSFEDSSTFSNLSAGTYNMYVRASEGCISQYSINVNSPAPVQVNLVSFTNYTCYGSNTASINVSGMGGNGGYQFSLNGGPYQSSGSFSGIGKGNNLIGIRDSKGCRGAYAFTVSELDSIYAEVSQIEEATCNLNDGVARVDSVSGSIGPYTFSTDNGTSFQTSDILSGLSAGIHNLIVQDAQGCRNDFAFAITQSGGIDVAAIQAEIKHLTCHSVQSGSIELSNINGGVKPYQFNINSGTFKNDSSFSGLAAGSHTISIRDNIGCYYYYTFLLNQPDEITFTLSIEQEETCENSDGVLLASNVQGGIPSYSYRILTTTWSAYQDGPQFAGLPSGSYTVEVKDYSVPGCSRQKSIVLSKKPSPEVYVSVNDLLCNSDESGAIIIDSVVGGEAPYLYSIDNGASFNPLPSFQNLDANVYYLQVRDQECTYNVSDYMLYDKDSAIYDTVNVPEIIVQEPSPLAAEIYILNTSYNQNSGEIGIYNISGGTAPYAYSLDHLSWMSISGDSAVTANMAKGLYTVHVKDTNNCEISYFVEIELPFLIPNLITPNGDGRNDYFEILSLPYGSRLIVVNQWGSRVYKSENYDNSWDASSLPDGTYYFSLELVDGRKFKGWVEVVR